ncbi:MAG: hydroxyacid dehydrogenase [Chloroflexi bacterium]|nr:hydroxyacid dehydrogenase [Chloroflexota bacterium]
MKSKNRKRIAFFEVEDWEREEFQKALGDYELAFFHGVVDGQALKSIQDANILSVFIHSQVTADFVDQLPQLEMIATRSTGYDHIDLDSCNRRGIVVSNVPYYGETTVAEHTFGLMLALSRNIHKAYVRTARGDFSLEGLEGFDLKGKTLGVVGAGAIGLHVIRIAKGFGMRVAAYDPKPNRLVSEVLGFEYAPLDDLLRSTDIISLHAPLTPRTFHLINKDSIRLIKRGAILINTARGALVDTQALIAALDEGILSGAGLDVLEGEDLIMEEKQLLGTPAAEESLRMLLRHHVLMRRENVVITPHIAFYSREALHRIVDVTIANIQARLEGKPQNVANAPLVKKAAA